MATFTAADVQRLMSHLQVGKANAIHAGPLTTLLGYNPGRNEEPLRELITYAISQGEVIASTPHHGYWIPASVAELNQTLNSLESRAQGDCDRRNNLINAWNTQNPHNQTPLQIKNVKP